MSARTIIIDLIGLAGLGMLGYGLWLVSPVHMFLGVGGLLCLASAAAGLRKGGG
ncbi:MAG: hypothetical protein ABW189_01440 [Rickettsiales bacterium]